MIKQRIVVNDRRIDVDKLLKARSSIHRPRKSFKTALALDEINEKMPSRLGHADESIIVP